MYSGYENMTDDELIKCIDAAYPGSCLARELMIRFSAYVDYIDNIKTRFNRNLKTDQQNAPNTLQDR